MTFSSAQKELVDPLWQWRYNGIAAGNGWTTLKNGAEFGTDYYTRTAVAYTNIYVNVPPEAVYFYNDNDSSGAQMNGQNLYTVTFAKGQLPPVKGFWSVTLYNDRLWMPQTPSGCSAVGLCRFRWVHFRYEASQIGDHAAVARRTRTRSTPDLNRMRLLSQIPGMLRKQRKGNVPDTGGRHSQAKRRAADIDDAVLQPGK